MKKIREKGMFIINIFFMLAAILPRPNIFLGFAMTLWIIFLIISMKESKSKLLWSFYLVLIVICVIYSIFILKHVISK